MTKVRRREIAEQVFDGFLDFGVYLFAVAGVFFSRYLRDFANRREVVIEWVWWELVLSAVCAMATETWMDYGGDPKGKRRAWLKRAKSSLLAGMGWQQIVGIGV